jgi:hypothetical protein
MREHLLQVRLIRDKTAAPRRVRSLWSTFNAGSIVDVENNRRREHGVVEWMRCRVHRWADGELCVIPVAT